jgi:hypothetical protein
MTEEQALEYVHGVISEHFDQFVLVAVSETDELYVDWTSLHTAEGLLKKGIKRFSDGDLEEWIDWADGEDFE